MSTVADRHEYDCVGRRQGTEERQHFRGGMEEKKSPMV